MQKKCDHEAIRNNDELWFSIPCIGITRIDADTLGYDDGLPPEVVEMRNCLVCGSTLSRSLDVVVYNHPLPPSSVDDKQ